MRRRSSRPLLLLLLVLFLLLSVRIASDFFRGSTAAILSPFWELLSDMKGNKKISEISAENQLLSQENVYLREELRNLRAVLAHEMTFLRQAPTATNEQRKRRLLALKELFDAQWQGVPAKVIFRSPDSWNSALWVNVGSVANEKSGREIVAKNSPVVVGKAVVGVVDYVGKRQSRVRLITDSALTLSVRALRDTTADRSFAASLEEVLIGVQIHSHFLHDEAEVDQFKSYLEQCLKQCAWKPGIDDYLAKGELHGSGAPIWRSSGKKLVGTGFNYDFADEEGEARDLRSGKPVNGHGEETPLIKVKDLLVTTGMDGVFPPGLVAAEVTKIFPLKEGDYFYDIEAKPAAGQLDDLSIVYILPPYQLEENERA